MIIDLDVYISAKLRAQGVITTALEDSLKVRTSTLFSLICGGSLCFLVEVLLIGQRNYRLCLPQTTPL